MKIAPLLMLLMTLVSCRNNYPKITDIEQISPVFEYVEIDGKKYIDVEKSFCLARNYRHRKGFIGSTTKAIELPIQECDRAIGYAPEEYAYYTTWKISFMNWLMRFR